MTHPELAEGRKRIPALDGVRGIAIILVLATHINWFSLITPWIREHLGPWTAGGYFGVDLFFALSGFLITSILIDWWRDTGTVSLRRFYVNRATRLLPALYVMLAVYSAVKVLSGTAFGTIEPTVRAAVLYVSNWQGDIGWGSPATSLAHLWSLGVEEQFYVVWPFIFLGLVRLTPRRALAAIAGGIVFVWVWRLTHQTKELALFPFWRTDMRADVLLAGAAAAFIHRNWTFRRVTALVVTCIGGSIFALHAVFGEPVRQYTIRYGLLVIALSAAALVLGLAQLDVHGIRPLGGRFLSVMGRHSYAIYLWHFPIWEYLTMHHASWGLAPVVAAAIFATAGAAALSWWVIERPGMKLRRFLL